MTIHQESIVELMEYKEDLVVEMIDETDSIEVIFQELVQSKKRHGIDNTIYCFYEGKDDFKYYPNRVKQVLNLKDIDKGIFSKGCGSKENVVKLYSKVLCDFEDIDGISLYFIDRDFQKQNSLGKKMYITPCYSIENLYAYGSVFDNFIENHLYITNRSIRNNLDDYLFLKNYYNETLNRELRNILTLNAWYSFQINNKHSVNPVNLKKLKSLSKIKSLTSVSELSEMDIQTLKGITDNYVNMTLNQLEEEKEYLNQDLLNNSRGKYVEEILVDIYKKIINESNSPQDFPISQRSIGVQVGKSNVKTTLMAQVITPRCLWNYLETNIN